MTKSQKNNPAVVGVLVLILVGSGIKTVLTLTSRPTSPVPPPADMGANSPGNPNTPSPKEGAIPGAIAEKDLSGLKFVSATETGMRDPFSHPLLTKQSEKQGGNSSFNGGGFAEATPRAGGASPASLKLYPISSGRVKNLIKSDSDRFNGGSYAPTGASKMGNNPLLPGLPDARTSNTSPTSGERDKKSGTGVSPRGDTERIAGWRLKAVLKSNSGLTALLEVDGGRSLSLHRGETVRGLRVIAIREGAIVLASQSGFWTLTRQTGEEESARDASETVANSPTRLEPGGQEKSQN